MASRNWQCTCIICGQEWEEPKKHGRKPRYCKNDRYPSGQGKLPAKGYGRGGYRPLIPLDVRKAIAAEYNNTDATLTEIAVRYGVSIERVAHYAALARERG